MTNLNLLQEIDLEIARCVIKDLPGHAQSFRAAKDGGRTDQFLELMAQRDELYGKVINDLLGIIDTLLGNSQ